VMALADRILVMREGRQMGIFSIEGSTQESIIAVATGSASAGQMALAS
jgi:rhamnose transport system ATP-binding protein